MADTAEPPPTSPLAEPTPEPPRQWKCGDPYHFKLPEVEGDSFEFLFQHLREQDQAQCSAWRDEVNYLLIFAGLLSAVVTAFIIETYKTLSPDPNNTVINLLSVIAAAQIGDGRQNTTNNFMPHLAKDPYQLDFAAPSAALNFNVFFFISLVLSLSTALFGIVSLQWLTIHESYPNTLSYEEKLALINMRMESFNRWMVPELFASFPILIQLALVTFFVGLISFLWSIDHTVVVPIAILIGITLLFLLVTTVLPTIRFLLLDCPYLIYDGGSKLPTECPYMSPQAAACHYLATSSRLVSALMSCILMAIVLIPIQGYRWFVGIIKQRETIVPDVVPLVTRKCLYWLGNARHRLFLFAKFLSTADSLCQFLDSVPRCWICLQQNSLLDELVSIHEILNRAKNHWTTSGITWLAVRNHLFLHTITDDAFYMYQQTRALSNLFDGIHGVRRSVRSVSTLTDTFLSAAITSVKKYPSDYTAAYLAREYTFYSDDFEWGLQHGTSLIYNTAPEERENYVVYRLLCSNSDELLPNLLDTDVALAAELMVEIMGYFYNPNSPPMLVNEELPLPGFQGVGYVLYRYCHSLESSAAKQVIILQWAMTIQSFFEAIDRHGESDILSNSSLAHPVFQKYLRYFFYAIDDFLATADLEYITQLYTQITSTIRYISQSLDKCIPSPFTNTESSTNPAQTNCLFYCASYYFYTVCTFLFAHRILAKIIPDLKRLQISIKLCKEQAKIHPSETQNTQGETLLVGGRTWFLAAYLGVYTFTEEWWKQIEKWEPPVQDSEGDSTSSRSIDSPENHINNNLTSTSSDQPYDLVENTGQNDHSELDPYLLVPANNFVELEKDDIGGSSQ